ncbi:hypothetical protein QC763_100930 [Podospora pseudopauciseta]|uniref:Methyltransferase domain-containing protein n=2 Tax=Podospora TaxID=5144 RepID=A0ABR0HW23_9PEZI|nr:hypothetical protein QC763_100930 [Podospora pseudopauciseta]KAK4680568.1 hypothetical protein QC764_100930 [Podospora pseudoanserina]
MPADFEKVEYWRKRFTKEESFEWLTSSGSFFSILEPLLTPLSIGSTVLHLGSGTSDLHVYFRRHFPQLQVINMDYEPLALERGKAMESNEFGNVEMGYQVQDVTLPLELDLGQRGKVRMVIDKSTVDAVSCGGDENVIKMAEAIHDVLNKEEGVWISLSFSDSRFEMDSKRVQELFEVSVLTKVATGPKRLESDPDIWHWCWLLRPRATTT